MLKRIYLITSISILCILSLFLIQHISGKKNLLVPEKKSLTKAITNKTMDADVLSASTIKEKTYTSIEGKYTITYPDIWIPSELPSQDSSGSGIPVFTVGPVGKNTRGYPSFIEILVTENSAGESLDDYLQQNFATANPFSPAQIASYSAEKTTNISSPVPTDSYFLSNNAKIYEIRIFHGAEPKITDAQFQKFVTNLILQ